MNHNYSMQEGEHVWWSKFFIKSATFSDKTVRERLLNPSYGHKSEYGIPIECGI